jgi:protein-disulfide isomerase
LIIVQTTARDNAATLPPRVATGEGRLLGDADAPVTLVMYADFQCPACKYAEVNIIPRLEEEYILTGKANIEFRMFPFLGQESWDAAQAAEAAREQGKFWQYHDALWNAQAGENRGAFQYDRLVELAGDVGLQVPVFEQTLLSNRYLDPIQQEVDAARDAGVVSTPTFFIGEQKIAGAQDYELFRTAIERALMEAGS